MMTCVAAAVLAWCAPGHAFARPPVRQTVYNVPQSIKANCSVAVDDKINAWLQTVPDNSTVQFGPGRCYGQNGTITLTNRNGLVIEGFIVDMFLSQPQNKKQPEAYRSVAETMTTKLIATLPEPARLQAQTREAP